MTALTDAFITQLDREYVEHPDGWAARTAARALADHAVCAAAGAATTPGPMDLAGDGVAHALGTPSTGDAAAVAAANAAAAHALDRDDLHWPSLSHPGGVVWPVTLALGEEADAQGTAAVRAAAIGYEVTARLARALGAPHRAFWHATTTAGMIGGAVAGALVAGGDVATAVTAACHAASVTGGSIQTVLERSGTRLFHRAHAARTAVAAARAALGGLDGTAGILEAPRGVFAALAPDADPHGVLIRSEDGWAIERVALRPYAASGFTHAAIDAALAIGPVDPDHVDAIRITTSPACVALAGDPRPADREAAWWSVQHAVGVCLLTGDASALESAELDGSSQLMALLDATEVLPDEAGDAVSATVEVRSGCRSRTSSCTTPLGHPDRPLDESALARKWTAMLPLHAGQLEELWSVGHAVAARPIRHTMQQLWRLLATASRRHV